jgi:hypothetical protein
MGGELLQAHLEAFDKAGAGVADERREGYDKQYEYAGAIKGRAAHGGLDKYLVLGKYRSGIKPAGISDARGNAGSKCALLTLNSR